jgi:cysteine desulfurase
MPERYLDHHSSQPLSPASRRALEEALDRFGDPLHLHERGRAAYRQLTQARETVADALAADPDEIVFTSGGTESVTLALAGVAAGPRGRAVLGAAEHPVVFGALAGFQSSGLDVATVPVDTHGRVDVEAFAIEVRQPGTVVASVQHANHEVGTMQPVAEAALFARSAGVVFHTDACQTAGRLPIDVGALGVDLLSISGHKFGGPPATGALFVRRGVRLGGLLSGDDRERRRRAGMQNLPAIVAMAAALRERVDSMGDQAAHQWVLTNELRRGLEGRVPGVRLHGHPTQRAPHLVCMSVPDVDVEALLMALDHRGFRLDAGSVASGSPTAASPVLAAMGVPDTIGLRAGVGPDTTEDDVEALVTELAELVSSLRRAAS